jgi:hypothetical protein
MFALGMALFMFALFVAVVDLDYLFTWSARVQAAAQTAAQSGANSVNPNFLYTPGGGTHIICDYSGGCPATQPRYDVACTHAGDVSAEITPDTLDYTNGVGQAQFREGTHCQDDPQGCSVGATVVKHVVFPLTVLGLGADVRGGSSAAPVIGSNVPAAGQGTCSVQAPPP